MDHGERRLISDRVHGLRFKAEVLTATAPTGVEGLEEYQIMISRMAF